MHPQFHIDLIHQRSQELEKRLNRARLFAGDPATERAAHDPVSLRLSRVGDGPIIERLAALEGRKRATGAYLLAETGGEVVAALPIAGGPLLADPFRRTAHLIPSMRARAARLSATPRPRIDAARAIAARVLHPAR